MSIEVKPKEIIVPCCEACKYCTWVDGIFLPHCKLNNIGNSCTMPWDSCKHFKPLKEK